MENTEVNKYILVSIPSEDYYESLCTLGDIITKNLGNELSRIGFETFKKHLPDLVCSVCSICHSELIDFEWFWIGKNLKICYTPEEIIDFIKKHVAVRKDEAARKDFNNFLFKAEPVFADIVHYRCNTEALIIKLVYDEENNYIKEKSDWLVI